MERLINKYAAKLIRAGLCDPGEPLVAGLDDELVWNREDDIRPELERLFKLLSINSLVCARPAEPFQTIINHLADKHPTVIRPQDCETRTFLHDLPVAPEFSARAMAEALRRRKSVIVPHPEGGRAVVACGAVSPEQGFVFLSSVCFAGFVLFFSEHLDETRKGLAKKDQVRAFERAAGFLPEPVPAAPRLMSGPFLSEDEALAAIAQAGRHTVDLGLVDSYFGNVSYRLGDLLYISQTGSSLDELEGCVDPCPMDDSSCAGLTASSELTAHMAIVRGSQARAILHGHPRFTVVLSMDCGLADCPERGQCHVRCPGRRSVCGVPVVPGEVGAGPLGLARTLPPAIMAPDNESGAAIVYGHGLFATDHTDFNRTLETMIEVENACRAEYFERLAGGGGA
ncbi:MAG: class II aldolase/adducin family protein [Desulfovibrionaceae bacterium]|nr:class II aldolase/adducin family protein [Desulfovibrionaceae bacterium]